MKKTVTIDNVQFDNEWTTQEGNTLYNFKVSYNGTEAIYCSKSKDQQKFVKGATIDVDEVVANTKNGGTMVKVKPWYEPKSKGVKSYTPIKASFSLSYAKDLVVADKIELKDLSKYADLMYDWLMSKN